MCNEISRHTAAKFLPTLHALSSMKLLHSLLLSFTEEIDYTAESAEAEAWILMIVKGIS